MRPSKACVLPDGSMMHTNGSCATRVAGMCMHVLYVHACVA